MKLRLSRSLFSSLTISAALVYGIYVAVQPRIITCSFEGSFSPNSIQRCRALLTPQFLKKQPMAAALHKLKTTVAGVEQCSMRYNGFQRVHVACTGAQPLALINNNTVISTAGNTMPASEIQAEMIERLPHIRVEDVTITQPKTVAHLFSFIKALPVDLFEQYRIVWHDTTAIYLIHQLDPQQIMVAHAATRFTPAILHAIATLQQQISEELPKKNRGARKKIIDVRVKGQIIIRHMQGGEYESTSGENYYHSH